MAQVPTEAYGDICFGVLDASTLRVTQVQATHGGLWLTLHKRKDGATPLQSELRLAWSAEADEVPTGWELLSITCPAVSSSAATSSASAATSSAEAVKPCAWLHARAGTGRILGNDTDECVQPHSPSPQQSPQAFSPRPATHTQPRHKAVAH